MNGDAAIRWRDVGTRRIAIASASAPIGPVAVGFILAFMWSSSSNGPWDLIVYGAIWMGAAVFWSLVLGILVFGLIANRLIAQPWHCYCLGLLAAASLYFVATMGQAALHALQGREFETWNAAIVSLYVIPLTIPFGLLGGKAFCSVALRRRINQVQ